MRIPYAQALALSRTHMIREANGIVLKMFTAAGLDVDQMPFVSDDGHLCDGQHSEPAALPDDAPGAVREWQPLKDQCRRWIEARS